MFGSTAYSVDKKVKDKISTSLVLSASYGYGKAKLPWTKKRKYKQKLLHESWTVDGLILSDRLHGASKKMRQDIADRIRIALKKGSTMTELARKLYDGYGYGKTINQAKMSNYLREMIKLGRQLDVDPKLVTLIRKTQKQIDKLNTPALKVAYKDLLDKAQLGSRKALSKSVQVALEEKSRYLAERIARTEIARAYGLGFQDKVANDSDVVAIRWRLGRNHPEPDICDELASANRYGLGKGVYPKDSLPSYPAHPHCTCMLEEVY